MMPGESQGSEQPCLNRPIPWVSLYLFKSPLLVTPLFISHFRRIYDMKHHHLYYTDPFFLPHLFLWSFIFHPYLCMHQQQQLKDTMDGDYVPGLTVPIPKCFPPPPPHTHLLGNSSGVVNSLDFCPASLKSLGCLYFQYVLSSQWKAVTVNFWILHCQLWRPLVIMCP